MNVKENSLVDKIITAECSECESVFEINYNTELVSEEIPCFCPFCGEEIEDVQEEIEEDDEIDDAFDDSEWR